MVPKWVPIFHSSKFDKIKSKERGIMKTAFTPCLIVVGLLISGIADAKDRYLVTFKSTQGYSRMHNYFSLAESNMGFQKSLGHIKSMVLKSPSAAALASLKNNPEVASVQKEYFFPSPRPVHGFNMNRGSVLQKSASQSAVQNHYAFSDVSNQIPVFVE